MHNPITINSTYWIINAKFKEIGRREVSECRLYALLISLPSALSSNLCEIKCESILFKSKNSHLLFEPFQHWLKVFLETFHCLAILNSPDRVIKGRNHILVSICDKYNIRTGKLCVLVFLSKLLFTFGTYSFKLSVKLSTLRGVVINSLKLADGMAVYFGRSDFHGLTKLLY